MNFIYIHTHDTGRYIQPYGHAVPTPNLMELAEDGILFRKCFSCAPTCSPSRAALLTGVNPHSAGMLGLAHRGFALREPQKHLANYLNRNGYETVLCGMQHLTTNGKEHELGYSSVLKGAKPKANLSGIYKDMEQDKNNAFAVAEYLENTNGRDFFISFGMFSTHFPLPDPAEDINPNYIQPPPTLPDIPEIRMDMAGYHTLARHADFCVGTVMNALEQNGLEENTLVVFTTDHGIAFPWMKCNLFDTGIGVSLIMRFPKREFAGQVVDSLVSHLDIYPTLCELANIDPPPWLEGKSLIPLIHGKKESIRPHLFGEVTYHAAYEPMRCIRTDRFKYIRYFDNFETVIKPNIDNSRSKRFLLDHGLKHHPHTPAEMLFDLYYDPFERNNLANKTNFTEIKTQLANELETWMRSTDDPLLKGHVPLPEGGYVNRQNELHPS